MMTSEMSETDAFKTNEIIRRRKLRLQQVREQSKDIAKKIRQRAKVEKLNQVVELDAKKQKEYFQRQTQLVKQLEQFYAKGIQNVGASHKNATELKLQEHQSDKVDLSKQRGKEAAAELRRKRQEKLDEQKKLLDRKLHAREAANEVSKEKSAVVANKLQTKVPSKDVDQGKDQTDSNKVGDEECAELKRDMATQWDLEPNEWEPNIPALVLPKDADSIKETNNNIESKSDKSKRIDLFALSEEMPSSLRGLTEEDRVPVKPSLTIVSEYLKHRGLQLRDYTTSNKNMDELHSLKHTIFRSRTSKEGTCVCQVHDEELVPVPTWREENHCGFCSHGVSHHRQHRTVRSMHVNNVYSPIKPMHPDILPNPILRGSTPFRRNKIPLRSSKGNVDKTSKSSALNSAGPKKNSVTMYNHSTRNVRDIPCDEERLVVRDSQQDDDAYSQAVKESSTSNAEKDHQKKVQEIRSKVAMTKQSVEKEYQDTISFLNSLPKDMGNKPIRGAYMDENRQQTARDSRQRKLQQEYKKIVKDCKKHNCSRNKTRSKSKSPSNVDFDSADFQYSWMPVPEGDCNLAVHTIPTSLREGKSGNTVKFSKVDSYHEYRSRHKHTPPTKDTGPKRFVEAVRMQTSDSEPASSESSSAEDIRLEKKDAERLSDAERIIIYKILDSKKEKSKKTKAVRDVAKSLTIFEQNTSGRDRQSKKINSESGKKISFEELNEGVYKAVNNKGDNIASMYFDKDGDKIEITEDEMKYGRPCCCSKSPSKDKHHEIGTSSQQWESGDNPPQAASSRPSNSCAGCKCGCGASQQPRPVDHTDNRVTSKHPPSTATSTSSFKTATNDKANNALPDGGYIKLIDEGGEETGKFYIGSSGFLKDDAYEVVIQLRKKGEDKEPVLPKISEEVPVSRTTVSVETIEKRPLDSMEVNNNDRVVLNTSKEFNESIKNVTNIVSEVQMDVNTVNTEQPSQSNQDMNSQRVPIVKEVSEKGVSTSFLDSYAIPSNVPKSESIPRPATSTYTQTSMSTPNHRPVYFHMSSSTSTAYMSPPEMILPKFLKQDRRMSDDDIYDPRNFEMQDKLEATDEHEYCENYECTCRKCRHARKVTICRTKEHRCRKTRHKSDPPPNSVGSDQDVLDDIEATDSNGRTCQCRKCISRNRIKPSGSKSSNLNKSKRSGSATKHSSQNIRAAPSSTSAKDAQKQKRNKTMNPIIRDYINKLLALNKESLKAVQVVDQDCSSITTPGSSIINVPKNKDERNPAQKTISLEQIKHALKKQIIDECEDKSDHSNRKLSDECLKTCNHNAKSKAPRRKHVHKVKSLNISKHLVKTKKSDGFQQQPQQTSSTSSKEGNLKIPPLPSRDKIRSKSSPTPRSTPAAPPVIRSKTSTNVAPSVATKSSKSSNNNFKERKDNFGVDRFLFSVPDSSRNRATTTSASPNSEISAPKGNKFETPTNMSTQTSINVDSEINFLRFDEDKIQNMEKIADLTEKCTRRLSNLAKVLEEVRKNKSLAYSQISTSETASDSDQKSDKNANRMPANAYQTHHDTQKSIESKSPVTFEAVEEHENNPNANAYIPFLTDIPKPDSFRMPTLELNFSSGSSNRSNPPSPTNESYEHNLKSRGKPPPALSRIHLKHMHDYVIPHELSTVVEVDSPMSVKLKSQTSRNDTRVDVPDSCNRIDNATYKADNQTGPQTNPDLLVSNVDIPGNKIATESEDPKIHMIDMNQFNEIMLKPFFSLQEYAKRHNIVGIDDASNIDDFVKGDFVNDELSSLHSDGSLPDVISELLKRNIISEPFKFDTGSNVNSTTISSESTLSVLALSKVRKEKKKSSVMFQNKENIGETSDTMSMSSNPDLESAFKRLGMGWASSTLKKTKERLALSSSSNTSSSSLAHFKMKSFNQEIPALVTDAVSSVTETLNLSNKVQQRNAIDTTKNAEQQTSLTKSMTVKEFLNNELAKKITFNNSRNETDEFVSLFETRMPDEMKHTSRMVREDSVETSVRSANRARTSTPVQLFKSMTYQSSSSSNISNGLFSNADDLSSVKGNSNSMKHSTSDKDDLTIPNFSLRINKKGSSECSNE